MTQKLILLIGLLIPLLAFGQLNAPPSDGGYSFLSGSAEVVSDSRCAALGHNTTVAPEGVTALFYNPGRLARIPTVQGSIGMRARWGKAGEDFDDISNQSFYQFQGDYPFHLKVNHLAVAVPIPPASGDLVVVLGAGYHTVWDMGFKQTRESEYGSPSVGNLVSKGGYSTVSGGFALDYKHKVGIGAAYNIPMFSQQKIESNSYNAERDIDGSYAIVGGYVTTTSDLTMALTWRQEIEFDNKLTIDDSPLNRSFTEKIKYPSTLSFGLEYRSSDEIAFMGEYQTRSFSQIEIVTETMMYSDILNDGDVMKAGIDLGGLHIGYFQEHIFVPETVHGSYSKNPAKLSGFTAGIGGDQMSFSLEYQSWTTEADDVGFEWKEELFLIRLTVNQSFQ